jgi:hypothetical protein
MIPRICGDPTVLASLGPAEAGFQEVPASPDSVDGTDEKGATSEVARCSGPSEVGVPSQLTWRMAGP